MPGITRSLPEGLPGHFSARPFRGFTTIELIVVLILTGILAAIGMGRFFDRGGIETVTYAEQVRAMLRHAQKTAIARNAPVFVRFEDSRISLCLVAPTSACAAKNQVQVPGGFSSGDNATRAACGDSSWYCLGKPAGISWSAAPALDYLSFDALGRPLLPSGASSGLVLTVSSTSGTQGVVVNEETGYVQ